jgi:hypothetical protein
MSDPTNFAAALGPQQYNLGGVLNINPLDQQLVPLQSTGLTPDQILQQGGGQPSTPRNNNNNTKQAGIESSPSTSNRPA